MIAETRVVTDKPAIYMKQLCRHFGHKVAVEFDDEHGSIQFPFGLCELTAEPNVLVMRVDAGNDEDFARIKGVVGGHLERFAFREELQVQWPA